MITNTERRAFPVIEITNEMPLNRMGGVGTVIENLISGFAAEGVDALWFVIDHAYPPAEVDEILRRFHPVVVGSAEELRHFTAPLLHVHTYKPNPALDAVLARHRVVCTIHSLLALEERTNGVGLGGARAWQEHLISLSARVVVLSGAEHRHYRALGYRQRNPAVTVIPNGVACAAPFRPTRGKAVLGYCGRLVPRKHPEYVQLLLGEAHFATRRVLVAGRGFSPYARNLLHAHGLAERVSFLGWCAGARLEAFFEAIDVLAVPSSYEPFGLVALEAAARGIPVVCTRTDGLHEVLGPHAFYCADGTYDAFRAAMHDWDDASPDELHARCVAARQRYEAHFTDRVMARRYRHLFAELAG